MFRAMRSPLLFLCVLGSAGAVATRARAQVAAPSARPEHGPASQGSGRVLGGHEFPFAQFVPTSFVVSTFGVRAGLESRRVPSFPTDMTTGASSEQRINLKTVIATEGFDVAVRVHRLVALTLDFYGKARVGINTPTLLGTGADFELGGNAGLLVRVLQSKRFQLSARAQGGYYAGQQAGIARFYQDVRAIANQTANRVINGDNDVDSERNKIDKSLSKAANGLLTSTSGVRAALMLTAALALNSYVGLQGVLGFNFDRSTYASNQFQITSDGSVQLRETVQQRQAVLGFALDLNGVPRGIPLDLVGEFVLVPLRTGREADVGPAHQTTFEQQWSTGLYYAGREDMQLGFSFYALLAQTRELGAEGRASGRPRDLGGSFSFRYIW